MGLLIKGIELAKDMQMAIVRVGVSLIEKKDIKLANSFRYCIIENSYLKDIALFQYPLALHKLALFIMSAYKVSQSKFDSCSPNSLSLRLDHLSSQSKVSPRRPLWLLQSWAPKETNPTQTESKFFYRFTSLVPSAADSDKQPRTWTWRPCTMGSKPQWLS